MNCWLGQLTPCHADWSSAHWRAL